MRLTPDQIIAIKQTAHAVLGDDALYVALIRKLGDRKIDIILKDVATPAAPVLAIAKQTGIEL